MEIHKDKNFKILVMKDTAFTNYKTHFNYKTYVHLSFFLFRIHFSRF